MQLGDALGGAGDLAEVKVSTDLAGVPHQHPGVHLLRLIDVAANDNRRGDQIQEAEDPNSEDQFLKVVSLGSTGLDYGSDLEEGDKSSHQKTDSHEETETEGGDEEVAHDGGICETRKAHSREGVAVHLAHGENADGEGGGERPSREVEVLGVPEDGLMGPVALCGEVPGHCEHDPPDVSGHREEVEHHEEDGTALELGALGDQGGVGAD